MPPKVLTPDEVQALWDEQCYGLGSCTVGSSNGLNNLLLPRTPGPAAPAVPGAPGQVVTIADVERFVPAVGALHMEPDGWAVVGVPANFWATVEPAVVQGELLGAPAEVRFTPRLYRWQYGDGTTRTTEAAGTSWAAAGQDELTATPTGHIYEQKADLGASVTVVWSAEYRVAGGDWIAVAGAVTSTSPDSRVLVVRERTVLTTR